VRGEKNRRIEIKKNKILGEAVLYENEEDEDEEN